MDAGLSVFHPNERYRFVKILGRGAYGVVVAAVDKTCGSPVAIKCMKNVTEDIEQSKLVLRELKLLNHFRGHENIIGVRDVYSDVQSATHFSSIFIVTHLMETDLSRVIRSNNHISQEHVCFFTYQILRGLKFLHSANVMHRDLKPQNLLVNANCDLRICDFGLARQCDSLDESQYTVYVVTRWYRAPELLLGNKIYDSAVDMWSVGCILGELLRRNAAAEGSAGRFALFPGHHFVGMLQMQLGMIGKPTLEDQQHVSERARQFLSKMKLNAGNAMLSSTDPFGPQGHAKTGAGAMAKIEECQKLSEWRRQFPGAPDAALEMLDLLLQFNPAKRLEACDALSQKYMTKFHDPSDEPSSSVIEFPDDTKDTTEALMRAKVFDEISNYNGHARRPHRKARKRSRPTP